VSAPEGERPILIVKRPKKAGNAHHGGAWKVAYADFVTAMMAFFMVMWLIAAVSKEQRAAIFDYFKNPSMQQGKSPRAAMGQMGPGGASTSVINLHGGLDARKSSTALSTGLGMARDTTSTVDKAAPDVDEAKRIATEAERKKLESLMAQLREAIDHSQALKPFKDQLLLDITPEGLRIQIVDAQNRPMFDLGRAKLKDYTANILHELAPYLNSVPNRISLSGHTDTSAYVSMAGYTNWDLSADRANAARRALEGGGLAMDKVSRRRPVLVGAVRQGQFTQSDPPAHQHHRDDEGSRRERAQDRRDAREPAAGAHAQLSPGSSSGDTAIPASASVPAPAATGAVPTAAPVPMAAPAP
jgi:chemotaxis protein MotB